ncbi:MAG: FtsQ-type POTRA domain-containing protein [Anaerolineales bacterium]|jgi:cell division septal protein FtsQ
MARNTTRRSDDIRQRRKKSPQKSVLTGIKKDSRRRSTRRTGRRFEQTAPPPMMVRGAIPGLPMTRKKRSRAKRRVDVSLGMPGVEMRLPSLPRVRIGWRLVSAVIVALLGFLLYNLWNSPKYQVNAAQIKGLQRISAHEVQAVLGLSGQPVFTLNQHELQDKLTKAFPEFESVSVQVSLPNLVNVSVQERVPVLIWRKGDQIQMVDADGIAFPIREDAMELGLPVVEASSLPPLLQLQDSQAELDASQLEYSAVQNGAQGTAQSAAQEARQFMSAEMVTAVVTMALQAPVGTTLVYDASHGLGWIDQGGWHVYFGDVADMQMKMHVYHALIEKLQQDGSTPRMVSVEYVHAPYFRLEN